MITMILKPCPFCHKDIPRSITVCPYCHRDEQGKTILMDSEVASVEGGKFSDTDLKDLTNPDPFIRDQAVVRLAQKGAGVIPTLIGILQDFSKPGLAGVAKVLGSIRDRRAIPALTMVAKMGDEDLRMAAVWALTQFHEAEVVPALLSEAERPHPTIQSFLAHTLSTLQDPRVISVLGRLLRHPNREVAFHAAYALGETGSREAIRPLRRGLRRRDPLVRIATAASLRRLGASDRLLLGVGVGWVLMAAVFSALAGIGYWWVQR
jgi:HEAT repeat protein